MTRDEKLYSAVVAQYPDLKEYIRDSKWVKIPCAPYASKQKPSVYATQAAAITVLAFVQDDKSLKVELYPW